MNKRCCEYPICFTWGDQPNDSKINFTCNLLNVNSTVQISEILANSEYKCLYDKDNNATAEIYVSCDVLEKTFHLGVDLWYTIKDVKNRIKKLEKIPLVLMHLFYNEILLRDSNMLQDYGIKNKSALTLGIKLHTARCEKCKPNFHVTNGTPQKIVLDSINLNKYEVLVPLSSPIERLKELIEEKYHVYPDHQLITCAGKKLEDDVTLEEYGITTHSKLLLLSYQFEKCNFCSYCAKAEGKPTIILKFFNNRIICAFNPEETVRKLKETSYQYLHHIHPDLQQITFKNQELYDNKTLGEYNIQGGSKLKIKLRFDRRRCDKCNEILL